MADTADAVVIGGGIVGTSMAHYLAAKGAKNVTLLEKDTIASGATGKSGALVRMHYTNPYEAALALKSLEVFSNWGDLIEGDGGFRKTGFLFIVGAHDIDKLAKNVEMLRKVGVKTQVISAGDVKELQPYCYIGDIGGAAYEPDSGYADGYSAATSMARRARELGVKVRQEISATAIVAEGDKITGVETTEGKISTPIVALAAGAWSAPLAKTVGVELPIVGRRATAGAMIRPPELSQPHMTYIDRSIGTYFRPEVGEMTHVGIGPLQRGSVTTDIDPDDYDGNIPTEWMVYTGLRLARRMPAMIDARWRRSWTGPEGTTPDHHMILDRSEDVEGLFVAAGMSGSGFKTGPAVGMCMAELMLDGKATSVDIHPFRLSRYEEGQPIVAEHEYVVPVFNPFGV